MRTRRTLRGHLAKIYAMHWASDSRYASEIGMWLLIINRLERVRLQRAPGCNEQTSLHEYY